MNMINARIKRGDQYGWAQKSRHRIQIKLRARNLTKEQADVLESLLRKALAAIMPVSDESTSKMIKELKK